MLRQWFVAAAGGCRGGALFTNHANGIDPSFRLHPGNHEAILQICRHRDGMPLAIELAASRVRTLSVAEIMQRLDARFRLLRIDGLVARSMIVAEVDRPAARYRMLETLRQFGAAQLTADDGPQLRSRHARHYVAVAEHARQLVSTPHTAAACPYLRVGVGQRRQRRSDVAADRLGLPAQARPATDEFRSSRGSSS